MFTGLCSPDGAAGNSDAAAGPSRAKTALEGAYIAAMEPHRHLVERELLADHYFRQQATQKQSAGGMAALNTGVSLMLSVKHD